MYNPLNNLDRTQGAIAFEWTDSACSPMFIAASCLGEHCDNFFEPFDLDKWHLAEAAVDAHNAVHHAPTLFTGFTLQ